MQWLWTMRLRSLITCLLSIFAILGILTAPMAIPSDAAAMAIEPMAHMDMSAMQNDISCCLDQKQSVPDCQKSCPLATICMAKCFPGIAQREFGTLRIEARSKINPYSDPFLDPTTGYPPDRPPRT
ncbi:hypothetical protein ATN84_21980 [Paramesorhizobium deserti]|uniref:Uncharacterized protein n=1 Tax=Paramesorhizobium deserti TaxID=1494590 RepID=A0A135HP68_9HYPH|nr:hypothetical protein ATN84_21980 [Paramesorhizobium deserti]